MSNYTNLIIAELEEIMIDIECHEDEDELFARIEKLKSFVTAIGGDGDNE